MARNSEGLTLGFIGGGEIDPATAIPLIENLLGDTQDVKAIFPLTIDLFTESLAEIGNWLAEQQVPYEVVVDDESSKNKDLKPWVDDAAKSHKVADVATGVVNLLEKANGANLIVLWSDDDGVSQDTSLLAESKNITLLDMLQGLEVFSLQEESETDTSPPAGEEPGEDEPYTREELEAIEDIDDLKKICEANEIEIPPRSRKSTYVEAILKAQGDAEPSAGKDDDEKEIPEDAPKRETNIQVPEDGVLATLSEEDWDGFRDMAEGIVEDIVQQVSGLFTELNEKLGTLGIHVDKILKQGTFAPDYEGDTPPSTGVAKKAAGTTKKAAASSNGGMTEAQAKAIVDEWGGKRGRPTAEVAEARKVLGLDQPQPSRPVGRPRKSAS
jgi:hypothetical protein